MNKIQHTELIFYMHFFARFCVSSQVTNVSWWCAHADERIARTRAGGSIHIPSRNPPQKLKKLKIHGNIKSKMFFSQCTYSIVHSTLKFPKFQ